MLLLDYRPDTQTFINVIDIKASPLDQNCEISS